MVKLQLLLYSFFKKTDLSSAELDCATHLAIRGFKKHFLKDMVDEGVFKTEQTVRNCLNKLKAVDITVKEGKEWAINPHLSLGVDKIICLDLKAMN
jgi:hypothetical protein